MFEADTGAVGIVRSSLQHFGETSDEEGTLKRSRETVGTGRRWGDGRGRGVGRWTLDVKPPLQLLLLRMHVTAGCHSKLGCNGKLGLVCARGQSGATKPAD